MNHSLHTPCTWSDWQLGAAVVAITATTTAPQSKKRNKKSEGLALKTVLRVFINSSAHRGFSQTYKSYTRSVFEPSTAAPKYQDTSYKASDIAP